MTVIWCGEVQNLSVLMVTVTLGVWMSYTPCIADDYFTSMEAMEELVDIEIELIQYLEQHIQQQQEILKTLTDHHTYCIQALDEAESRAEYVNNPLNAYALVKRVALLWPKVLDLLPNKTDILGDLQLPTAYDVRGVIMRLARLQDVYNISASTLAQGHLKGTFPMSNMTAEDCLGMGVFYYRQNYFDDATPWFEEALHKVDIDKTVTKAQVLEYLFLSTCFQGNQDLSTSYLNELLDVYQFYTPPDEILFDYNLALKKNCSNVAVERLRKMKRLIPQMTDEEIHTFNLICQGKTIVTPQNLHCYYTHHNNPYLRIGPFKTEELYYEPPIVMFHDIISDDEIEQLQNDAYPYMIRARIMKPDGSGTEADFRTSKIAWLDDNERSLSRKLSLRVANITNLEIKGAEVNQINNYGVGGEYVTHVDAVENLNLTEEPSGNRIATFMFYMSEVALGGQTVFPILNISVVPRKGSGIFWLNLNHDGTVNGDMRHGSCPVIIGSKWVCNKWIHEEGQDTRLPCLKKQENKRNIKHLLNVHGRG